MAKITLLIVDDHSLFRDGLRSLLERQEAFAVVGAAGDAETGIRLAVELRPSVILMDLQMPGRDGVGAIQEIIRRWPHARIIALSMYQEPQAVENALLAGASGYLLKDVGFAVLLDGIRAVAAGAAALDPHVASHVLDEYRRLAAAVGECGPTEQLLSPRETTILEHLVAGLSNRQIAAALFLSEQTVKNLLTSIYQKMGVQNRTEAVSQAIRRGLVKPKQ